MGFRPFTFPLSSNLRLRGAFGEAYSRSSLRHNRMKRVKRGIPARDSTFEAGDGAGAQSSAFSPSGLRECRGNKAQGRIGVIKVLIRNLASDREPRARAIMAASDVGNERSACSRKRN